MNENNVVSEVAKEAVEKATKALFDAKSFGAGAATGVTVYVIGKKIVTAIANKIKAKKAEKEIVVDKTEEAADEANEDDFIEE